MRHTPTSHLYFDLDGNARSRDTDEIVFQVASSTTPTAPDLKPTPKLPRTCTSKKAATVAETFYVEHDYREPQRRENEDGSVGYITHETEEVKTAVVIERRNVKASPTLQAAIAKAKAVAQRR